MKIRVADYIAQLLVENNITQIFSVVGGGAMHLNDAFGNHQDINCTYNHHEQACAIAAESYARVNNDMAAVCVTTGPGGTNAITGVLCSWQDSIPMLVISGQVRYDTTVASTELNLRQFGEQEHYIIETIRSITKYSTMLTDTNQVRYEIEKAIYLAKTGRCGPSWIDVPLNIQGAVIESDDQQAFIPDEEVLKDLIINSYFININNILKRSKRPLIVIGAGIRTSGIYKDFLKWVENINIPIIAGNGNPDLLSDEQKNYYGNFGVIGSRVGNFIVQNADCLVILGCRLSFKQIGFNYKLFSPNSKKIVIDIDDAELQKTTLEKDLAVHMDLRVFFQKINLLKLDLDSLDPRWLKYCEEVKKTFPIYQNEFSISETVNPYYFANKLKNSLPKNSITVLGNSCACDMIRQFGTKYNTQRIWGNTNCGTMGYDLPAAIGAAIASKKSVICVTGDGSIQMNIQELQTIVHNSLPIKIFVHNNNGYMAITQTQGNFFGRLSGCTKSTGLSFPNFELLAKAYGFPYYKFTNHQELDANLTKCLNEKGFCLCEIISDDTQPIIPKLKSKILENGNIVSPSLDDLFPFLDKIVQEKYMTYFNIK